MDGRGLHFPWYDGSQFSEPRQLHCLAETRDTLRLDFAVMRELEEADRGQNLEKLEGGGRRSALKMVRQRGALA
jgi:hypothetical protein